MSDALAQAGIVSHTIMARSSALEANEVRLLGGQLARVRRLRPQILHLYRLGSLQNFQGSAFRGAHSRGGSNILDVLLNEVSAVLG